ncbi:MAG TPA: CRISPR-associated RAMP protein Csx7 [Chloroflexota bacterium]|nr:CRISPR-associated RAMP protein Csx7 [Chloroflexota bacterium]
MHRQLLNECRLSGSISTDAPLLIRSAVETIAGPEVGVVLTVRDGLDQPYIPGSSLKGALRSQAERILRTLRPDSACNPLDDRGPQRSCARRLEERERELQRTDRRQSVSPATAYRDSCAACKTFGSAALAGRVFMADGYLRGAALPALVRRDGVGIDRFSGAASLRSRWELEAVTDVTFGLQVTMQNFEIWQLALLGLVLQDLVAGRLPLGSGKSRGLGRVQGEIQGVELAYLRSDRVAAAAEDVLGVGALFDDGSRYGYRSDDRLPFGAAATQETLGIRRVYSFSTQQFPWSELTEALLRYLEHDYRPSPWLSRAGEGETADAARVRQ